MIKTSDSIKQIAFALQLAQSEVINPPFNATASLGKYDFDYVTLDAEIDLVREILAKYQLSVFHSGHIQDNVFWLESRLMHESGEWIQTSIPFPLPAKAPPTVIGSILTYGRRYSLPALMNFAANGEDGVYYDDEPEPVKATIKPKGERHGTR